MADDGGYEDQSKSALAQMTPVAERSLNGVQAKLPEQDLQRVFLKMRSTIEDMARYIDKDLQVDFDIDNLEGLEFGDLAELGRQVSAEYQTKLAEDIRTLEQYDQKINPSTIPSLEQTRSMKSERDKKIEDDVKRTYGKVRAVFTALYYGDKLTEVNELHGQQGNNGWVFAEGSPAKGVVLNKIDVVSGRSQPVATIKLDHREGYNSQISGVSVDFHRTNQSGGKDYLGFTLGPDTITRELSLVTPEEFRRFQEAMAEATADVRQILRDHGIAEAAYDRLAYNPEVQDEKAKEFREKLLWNEQGEVIDVVEREAAERRERQKINPYNTNP